MNQTRKSAFRIGDRRKPKSKIFQTTYKTISKERRTGKDRRISRDNSRFR
ncbi:MAG: hypothetical protein K8R49_06985 [Candidatus Cloacimonetes bacterium]|nr:hypothetical protein [Candidatus Cloacimonadota bacterium]